MKEMHKKFLIIIIAVSIVAVLFVLTKKDDAEFKENDFKETDFKDTVKYEGETYVLLEYNMDILTYNYNNNEYLEEDLIHPVPHEKWDIVYFNGDLFVYEGQVEEATKYYASDENYEWFIVFENEESEEKVPITIDGEELDYLYNIEKIEKTKTIIFDEIKQFADVVKESKDGLVFAVTNLVHCEDAWYWKTEIMNDNDEEYVIGLPDSFNEKIFELLAQ